MTRHTRGMYTRSKISNDLSDTALVAVVFQGDSIRALRGFRVDSGTILDMLCIDCSSVKRLLTEKQFGRWAQGFMDCANRMTKRGIEFCMYAGGMQSRFSIASRSGRTA